MFQIHEDMRDMLTKYNDTVIGKCSICLSPFCSKLEDSEAMAKDYQAAKAFLDKHSKQLADGTVGEVLKVEQEAVEKWILESEEAEEKFTERADLVRIDKCFHRFHTLCLWRDWFMTRQSDTDQYGEAINYKLAEVKRCPVCRREVSPDEVAYVKNAYEANLEIEDNGYK